MLSCTYGFIRKAKFYFKYLQSICRHKITSMCKDNSFLYVNNKFLLLSIYLHLFESSLCILDFKLKLLSNGTDDKSVSNNQSSATDRWKKRTKLPKVPLFLT